MDWYHIVIGAAAILSVVAWLIHSRVSASKQAGQALAQDKADTAAGRMSPAPACAAPAPPLELIAVITAAVLCAAQAEGRLVVRDIRRAGSSESLWAQAGRIDLMSQR